MKKAATVFSILVLLCSGVWLGLPAYRAHKEKRFAAQASEALAKKEHRRALLCARQALVLNSNNLTAVRVMADLADLSRSPQSIVWRRRSGDRTVIEQSNRFRALRTALRATALRTGITPSPESSVESNTVNAVSFQLAAAQLALKQGRMSDAEHHFQNALRLEPTNNAHKLNLAVVRLESKDAAVSALARRELEQFQSVEPWSGPALRSLIAHHVIRKEFEDAERYSTSLLRTTNALFGDKLEHLTILQGGRKPEFDHRWKRCSGSRHKRTDGGRSHRPHGPARSGHGRDRLGENIASAGARRDAAPRRDRRLLCGHKKMGRNGKDADDAAVARARVPAESLARVCRANQNVEQVAMAHWDEAVQLASERPELTLLLAQLGSNWQWTNETETLLWRAAKHFPQEQWPLESLQTSYGRLRRTRGLFDVSTLILERQPTNAVAQNNWAALAFLLKTNQAKAHQLARQVYDRDPNNFGFVSTYAWSLHLQGKTAAALRVMETLDPSELETRASRAITAHCWPPPGKWTRLAITSPARKPRPSCLKNSNWSRMRASELSSPSRGEGRRASLPHRSSSNTRSEIFSRVPGIQRTSGVWPSGKRAFSSSKTTRWTRVSSRRCFATATADSK